MAAAAAAVAANERPASRTGEARARSRTTNAKMQARASSDRRLAAADCRPPPSASVKRARAHKSCKAVERRDAGERSAFVGRLFFPQLERTADKTASRSRRTAERARARRRRRRRRRVTCAHSPAVAHLAQRASARSPRSLAQARVSSCRSCIRAARASARVRTRVTSESRRCRAAASPDRRRRRRCRCCRREPQ